MGTAAKAQRDGGPISARNAFVVQLRQRPGRSAAKLSGRVEHVPTGKVAYFESADQLIEFVLSVLPTDPDDRGTGS